MPRSLLILVAGLLAIAGLLLFYPVAPEHERTLEAQLRALGYRPDEETISTFLGSRLAKGASPTGVALELPRPVRVEWCVSPIAQADSLLLERFYIGAPSNPLALHLYYERGGGLKDWYLDGPPSIDGCRSVTPDDAEVWRRAPLERISAETST
jgi:hypothetical protein